jgi:hypothetical protein
LCIHKKAKGPMRILNRLTIFSFLACLLLLNSCGYQDSPAPGCVKGSLSPSNNGCFGKIAIIDLALVSTPSCLVIEVNNCSGGVLEIRNTCAENVHLGGIVILSSASTILDIREKPEGLEVFETDTDISQYIPEDNRQIKLQGNLGSQPIEIGYTKTSPLCE